MKENKCVVVMKYFKDNLCQCGDKPECLNTGGNLLRLVMGQKKYEIYKYHACASQYQVNTIPKVQGLKNHPWATM